MVRIKTSIVIVILAAIVVMGTAATNGSLNNFKNLQVLPKNISDHQLDSIMDIYNRALQVNCDFCHEKTKDLTGLTTAENATLDFAADNSMKNTARKMMRLTIDINKAYFNYDTIPVKKPDHLLNVVSCNTCHRGNAFPSHE